MNSRRRAFTLVEILTVITIMMILAALTIVVGTAMLGRSRVNATTAILNQCKVAALNYRTANRGFGNWGTVTPSITVSQFLIDVGNTAVNPKFTSAMQPNISGNNIKDSWGKEIYLTQSADLRRLVFTSLGADGKGTMTTPAGVAADDADNLQVVVE